MFLIKPLSYRRLSAVISAMVSSSSLGTTYSTFVSIASNTWCRGISGRRAGGTVDLIVKTKPNPPHSYTDMALTLC